MKSIRNVEKDSINTKVKSQAIDLLKVTFGIFFLMVIYYFVVIHQM